MRSGIFGIFCDSLAKHYGGYQALQTGWVSDIQFEPSVGASILRKMVSQYENIELLLNTKALSYKKTKAGWIVETLKGSKKIVLSESIIVDATELGDVAAACGAKYDVGMESRLSTGEDIAPEKPNGIVQDLTYVAVLKDFGPGADKTIAKPQGHVLVPLYADWNAPALLYSPWNGKKNLVVPPSTDTNLPILLRLAVPFAS
jgi:hypothetical protein